MTRTPKPVTIPRNLKPGTRLWYSGNEWAVVRNRLTCNTPYFADGSIRAVTPDGRVMFYDKNGIEECGVSPDIIRIERIASAKPKRAKVDKDAAAISAIADTLDHRGTSGDRMHLYDFSAKQGLRLLRARLRAIARRLNNGDNP